MLTVNILVLDHHYICLGKLRGRSLVVGMGYICGSMGEVCGTAIETLMRARVRLSFEKGKSWARSLYHVTDAVEVNMVEGKGEYAALGIDPDLREALRGLISWLVGEKGLSRVEGYRLASVAGDLKIAEAVDMPYYAVAFSLPLNVFVGSPYVSKL